MELDCAAAASALLALLADTSGAGDPAATAGARGLANTLNNRKPWREHRLDEVVGGREQSVDGHLSDVHLRIDGHQRRKTRQWLRA